MNPYIVAAVALHVLGQLPNFQPQHKGEDELNREAWAEAQALRDRFATHRRSRRQCKRKRQTVWTGVK